nr:hypothetical protein [Tanacetum cinerariifolium]
MRPGSLRHVTGDDFLLGNLKFVLKGEKDKFFGIPIPKELITYSIQRSEYYKQYVEMAARKVQAKEGGMKKTTPKADKPVKLAPAKQSKPATAKQHKLKPVKKKSAKPTSLQKADKGKRRISLTEEASTRPSAQPEDDASANIICNTPSPTDAETGDDTDKTNNEADTEILNIGGKQEEDVSNKEDLDRKTAKIDEGQAGSDLGKTLKSRPPPKYARMEEEQAGPNLGLSHVALSGPDPEPMHDDFVTTISTGTILSMKNLDAYTYGDQFFSDKPTKEDPGKKIIETEVESMVTVLIHQASFSVPPLSTPVINLTPPKPVPSTTQAPIFTPTTTTKTTTTTLPPPPQQQSSSVPDLASRVSTLE